MANFPLTFMTLNNSWQTSPKKIMAEISMQIRGYSSLMPLCFFIIFGYGFCKSDVPIGYQLSLEAPAEYSPGFVGRAFLMENGQIAPNFKVALSIEAINEKYSCSLQVFLGDIKVWNSGHYSHFYTSEKCLLELNEDGDLRLKGGPTPTDHKVGWRTGTYGQGVQRLQILMTGNLVLVDGLDNIKWQSFNFPGDVMLWGQRLNVATRLTAFPILSNVSTTFLYYSLEIEHNKIALYLHSYYSGSYSYWDFKPTNNRNITFIKLGSKGLELFDDKNKKIAQILSQTPQPLRFLALGNKTGNLGFYSYSATKAKFESSFQALNTTCDLPLACKPFGICTFSNACSCVRQLTKVGSSDCNGGINSGGFCGSNKPSKVVEMLEIEDVTSVLKDKPEKVKVFSKQECLKLCLHDCNCSAALILLYSSQKGFKDQHECFLYRMILGLKQVQRGSGVIFMVKVSMGIHSDYGKTNLKRWVLVLVGVADGFIILLVLGGLCYFFVRKRRNKSLLNGHS